MLTWFTKNINLFVNLIIVLVLVVFALWDATNILIDYVKDNRYTFVKIISLNDTFPFLESVDLRICAAYGSETVLPAGWINENLKADVQKLRQLVDLDGNLTRLGANESVQNLSPIQNQMKNAFIFDKIKNMDENYFYCVIFNEKHQCLSMPEFAYLENYLKEGITLDKLRNDLWLSIQPNVFWRPGNNRFEISELTVASLTDIKFCINLHLSYVLSRQKERVEYFVGVTGVH